MQAHSAVRFFRFLSLYTISSPSFPAKSVAQVSNNNKNNKTKQNKPKIAKNKQTNNIDASATRKNLGVKYRSRAWKSIVLFFLQKNKKI